MKVSLKCNSGGGVVKVFIVAKVCVKRKVLLQVICNTFLKDYLSKKEQRKEC